VISRRLVLGFLALLVAGCGIPVENSARPVADDDIPSSLPNERSPSTQPVGDPSPSSVEVFFVREARLVAVRREVLVPPSVEGVIAAVAGGLAEAEQVEGKRTALTGDVRLAGTVTVGVPLIDLTESFAQIELEEQILALGQLVFTLTAVPGVTGVSFALFGRPVEVPTGDGTLKGGPLRRDDFAAVAPSG